MTHRALKLSGILGSVLAGALVASALGLAPAAVARPAQRAAVDSDRLPTITQIPPGSGIHGYPYDAVPRPPAFAGAPYDQPREAGYAGARVHDVGRDQHLQAERHLVVPTANGTCPWRRANVPYTTRLLVRYPTSPAKFNGTVVVRVAQRHDRRRSGPGVGGDLQRADQQGLRLCRRDRAEARNERPRDLGPGALRHAGRQQRRRVLRHLHPGRRGREGRQRDAARRADAEGADRHRRLAVRLPGRHLRQRDPADQPRLQRLPGRRPGGHGGTDRRRAGRACRRSRR